MIEKIKKTYYIINASALFVLLVALTCYVCEKAHNERIRSYASIKEESAANMKHEAELKHLQAENLKYNYYARLYDDPDFDKWEEIK